MLILCALLAAAAVLCWPGRGLRRQVAIGAFDRSASSRGEWSWWQRHRPGRPRAPATETVLVEVLEAVAAALAAGLPPRAALVGAREALESRIRQSPGLAVHVQRLVEAADEGDPLGPLWVAAGHDLGLPLAARVGRSWAVSERLGAPLTGAVRATVVAHETTARIERAFAAQQAGPTATVHLLTLLPVLGLAVMPVLGVDLRAAYPLPVVLLAVVPGLGLVWLGRRLTRRMVDHALQTPGLT